MNDKQLKKLKKHRDDLRAFAEELPEEDKPGVELAAHRLDLLAGWYDDFPEELTEDQAA